MQTVSVSGGNIGRAASQAADILRAGGVILYPTDTLYGLGADAFSDVAVGKIYGIKGREPGKPMHALVSSIEMAEVYGEVGEVARQLLQKLPRGKVTFIVQKRTGIDSGICRGIETFGFRIPDNAFCLALIEHFGSPVTATSANTSGFEPKRIVPDILAQLGEGAENITLVLDAGELPPRKPSTVLDCTAFEPVLLREGAVSASEVWKALDTGK